MKWKTITTSHTSYRHHKIIMAMYYQSHGMSIAISTFEYHGCLKHCYSFGQPHIKVQKTHTQITDI